jgi:signal peptidase I
MTKQKLFKEIVEWTLTIVIPVVAALLIHTYLFTFARVDGSSMLDTFHDNNIMGVSRLHYRLNEPQRGEVITCHYDQGRKLYVKRVIGLPGETVEMKAGQVYIDGVPLNESYLTRPDDRDFGPYEVGADEIFVMGDNRPVSKDSRMIGAIPKDYIYGRVLFVAYPFNEIRGTLSVPDYN